MNNISANLLKLGRKVYSKISNVKLQTKPKCENDVNIASELIYNKLVGSEPCMIARYGATEMLALENYYGVHNPDASWFNYIRNKCTEWWWVPEVLNQMKNWSGFFPTTPVMLERFSELMIEDTKYIDLLGSWLSQESLFAADLEKIDKIRLLYLDPYWSKRPWTRSLAGKKVLVVHPFAESIKTQYSRREKLFKNPEVLPEFELSVIKAVQSLGGSLEFKDWFEALDEMKSKMDSIDYEICLLGCGAYGFPLAAHAKRMGKKAVHIGGSLQLLFGIIGNRWEDINYAQETKKFCPNVNYPSIINKHWLRPNTQEHIKNAQQVEGATYW